MNLRNEINTYITRLCKNVINLLELGAKMVTDRKSLVEKCLVFYNLLLNIEFAGNCIVTHLAIHCITLLFKVMFGVIRWQLAVIRNLTQDPWLEHQYSTIV